MGERKLTKEALEEFVRKECPYVEDFGIRCEELGNGYAVLRWRYDERWLRPGRYVFGGLVMMLADMAIYYAILSVVGLKPMAVTNELKINFLRPAVGTDMLARGEVLKVGRRIAYGEIRLYGPENPGRLLGHATSSYVLPDD